MVGRRTSPPMSTDISAPTADVALEELLAARWSCRAFRPDPVPRRTVERMLDMAQRSPSWCNTQPWQVIVTSGRATARFREGLRAHAVDPATVAEPDLPFPPSYEGVHQQRRREVGWMLYDAVGVPRGDRAASARQALRNFELFDAPHVAIVTTDARLGVYGAVDSGLYIGSLLLAAQSLGIATIAQAALATYSPFVRSHFGIPDDRLVLAGVSFGYADLDHPANAFRAPRAGLAEIATWVDD